MKRLKMPTHAALLLLILLCSPPVLGNPAETATDALAAAPHLSARGAPPEWVPFIGALNSIQRTYVREATSALLITGALDGVLGGLANNVKSPTDQERIRAEGELLRSQVQEYYESQPPVPNFNRDYNTLERFLRVIRKDLGPLYSNKDLVPNAITGMVGSLQDPHSVFLNKQRNQEFQKSISGDHESFGGIGVHVAVKDNDLTVISPLPDSPASRVGIKAGDVITAVNDESTEGLTIEECVSRMKGEIGTPVTLTVRREAVPAPLHYTLNRAKIVVKNVTREMLNDAIGYVDVRQFEKGVTDETRKAMLFLTESGAKSVIIDLRYNPGGLLDEAAAMSDLFLKDGLDLVSTEGRLPGQTQKFVARDRQPYDTKPDLLVLINRYSASASEILAGALQAHGRARIVGETSFGKGSVQQIFGQSDGSGLKLTIARYYTPKGVCIDHVGIEPDIEYVSDEVDDATPSEKDKVIKSATDTVKKSSKPPVDLVKLKKKYGDDLAVRISIDPVLQLAVDTFLSEKPVAAHVKP